MLGDFAIRLADGASPRMPALMSRGMSRRLLRLTLAVPLVAGVLPAIKPAAASALTFGKCSHIAGFSCATLTVPTRRGAGAAAGTLTLHVARRLGGSQPSSSAVLALAGGPGQPALPLAQYFAKAMSPALASRDLLVFDQRGTGKSDPLGCGVLEPGGAAGIKTIGGLVERCGEQIGEARSGYSSAESVQDIEAIRQATGYEKLVLYGTSYGTKVAEQYAETYPSHVEALILDSVVPPEGEEPFKLSTFKAIKRVLAEICVHHACREIAAKPLSDLAHLASRLRRRPLHGVVYNGKGKRGTTSLGEEGLFDVLIAGDLNPALRAMVPAAVHAALHRDPAAMLRLKLLSEGLVPTLPRGRKRRRKIADEIDSALLIDTTCEDTPFPWSRSSPPETRLDEAIATLKATPSTDFYPFDATTAFQDSLQPGCAFWPYSSTAPTSPAASLPDVPTLILSGAQDLRTPTSNAREVARMIPDAQLLVVPYTGHSVLGSDFSGCAEVAVEAFFEDAQVLPCGQVPNLFSPTPAIPRNLASTKPVLGLAGRPGRTLRAVVETMIDLDRQVIGATLQADAELPSGSSFGGLRGGYAKLTKKTVELHRFSFVPGVQLNGAFPVKNGEVGAASIRITGSAAAHGHVRIGSTRTSGVLGGRHFDINLKHARLASAGRRRQWKAIAKDRLPRSLSFPLGPLAHQP